MPLRFSVTRVCPMPSATESPSFVWTSPCLNQEYMAAPYGSAQTAFKSGFCCLRNKEGWKCTAKEKLRDRAQEGAGFRFSPRPWLDRAVTRAHSGAIGPD